MTDAVRLDEVQRYFGAVHAVDAMSWRAPAGAITAILGPNGAGKTTSIECAVGLQQPDGGTVRVLGADPWHSPPEHRARVGVMLQNGGLPNGAKPIRLLRHLAGLYSDPLPVEEIAGRLGITQFAGTTVRRLSGGQKQRLAMAAALIGRPELVFLDEPTAGLDPHGRLDVWDLISELREAGQSVIVTTHSFDEAERLGEHIVIVSNGHTVAEGTLADITADGSLEQVYFALTRKVAS